MSAPAVHHSKIKLLDASLLAIRRQGYAATTIDDLCSAAGVSKGSFFHHFSGKEELALAAAAHFSAMADGLFSHAPYRSLTDPLARLLGYVDFRKMILRGDLPHYTCLLGTMVQETYDTHPAIREVCNTFITAHAAQIAADISAAQALYAPQAPWSATSLSYHIQAVIQGAFILAKAQQGSDVAAGCLDHLHRYIVLLFQRPNPKE